MDSGLEKRAVGKKARHERTWPPGERNVIRNASGWS